MNSAVQPMVSALFRMAITSGTPASVLMHLQRGADVNGRDPSGATPLMLAMARGRGETCRLLLEHGADPRLLDNAGRTVLAYVPAGNSALAELAALSCTTGEVGNGAEVREVDAGSGGDSGWEAEEEQETPADDACARAAASRIQAEAATWRATSSDEEWSDVDVQLPIPPANRSRDPARQREHLRLQRVFRQISLTGRFTVRDIAGALEPASGGARSEDGERRWHAALRTAEAMGAEPEEWSQWAAPADESRREDDVGEALEFYEQLWTADTAIDAYFREVTRRPVATREIEQTCWRRYAAASLDLWRSLVAAPSVVGHLLNDLGREQELIEQRTDEQAEVEDDGEEGPSRVALLSSAVAALCALRVSATDQALRIAARAVADLRLPLRSAEAFAEGEAWAGRDVHLLLRRARRAHDRIAESNLKLVIWQARRFGWSSLPLEDRIQEGNLGLLKAIERFDPEYGNRFTTYAVWWIRQSISRAIQDLGRTIRVPVHVIEHERRVRRAAAAFESQHGREGTPDELANAIGGPVQTVERILRGFPEAKPLDEHPEAAAIPDGENGPEERVVQSALRAALTAKLVTLPPREERILRMRFGMGLSFEMTLEEVGVPFEVTRERIRQIEHKALVRLAHPSRSRKLRSFVGA